jgi:N-acetylglucosaminyldiphosphoundecaprenol N-acetyl-beta-D-mannosaminyltransferase
MTNAIEADKKNELPSCDKRVNVVGLMVNVCDYESAIEQIGEMVAERKGNYVCVANVHMTMESRDDPEFGRLVNNAGLVVPDGMPLVWMQKLQGEEQAGRVRGPGLMPKLCRHAEKNNLIVGFYGGKPEVLEAMLKRLKEDYPRLKVGYAYSPPFRKLTPEEDAEIVKNINESGTDILFAGLGCPKQERWMAEHKESLRAVMIGVGAAFDFYAGNIDESPEWLQKAGLEWFYRLMQEPARLWKRYLILNPRFMILASLQLFGLKKF